MPDRPNIVQIIAHDLGTHLGCYGAGLRTPQIDRLAAEGVCFTDHHCTAAQCSPARGSITTGLYPHNNGLVGLTWGWELHDDLVCMPERLRRAGYSTHLFGVQHETGGGISRLGYETRESAATSALPLADELSQWLRARSSSGEERPFFVSMGTSEPHRPYHREGYRDDDPADVTPLPWLPDRPAIRHDIAGLNGLVYALDEAVGVVRQAVEDSGLADNTLLIVTCDHGIAMPRAKCTCYDPGTRTALIMRLPGRWDDGAVHDELLTNCDLMPTLMELVGEPVAEPIDGRSFLGLLDGADYEPREQIFTEMTYHGMYNPMRCVRTKTHKYIRNLAELPLVYMPVDIWEAPAGQEMAGEYYSRARPREELYDLQADPWEQENLAGEAGCEDLLCELSGRVDAWMEASGDPLLRGRYPASDAHRKNMRGRLDEERFAEWMRMTLRDWPEMLWFFDERAT
ncbi:MAG: sulfatase [Armatimonadota bacterium]|jgi:N-sulfoglucosamine sulfohydrolase